MTLNELKSQKRWVGWNYEERGGKITKVPKNGRSGYNASSNKPQTWESLPACEKGKEMFKFDGVGVILGEGICGIDLDHVRDPATGETAAAAEAIIKRLDSYTELSPSGTGYHILCYVGMDGFGTKKPMSWTNPANDGEETALEVYHPVMNDETGLMVNGRYFTFTGKALPGYEEIQERTEEVEALICEYFGEAEPEKIKVDVPTMEDDMELTPEVAKRLTFDKQLFSLYKDGKGTLNASQADYKFAVRGLKLFKGDSGIVTTLWRKSALSDREKADRPDYWARTISKALQAYQKGSGQQTISQAKQEEPKKRSINYQETDKVTGYFSSAFCEDIKELKQYSDRMTGFDNLDAVQPLYPGLYAIGAASGLGKTTLMGQMCDQLAERGEHVLFFSLEQTKLEMVSKSLSRIIHAVNPEKSVSAIDIRRGKAEPKILENAINYFKRYAARVNVIDCTFETTAEDIIQYCKDFMEQNPGIKPIVIIDYLQAIPGAADGNNRRTAMDITSMNMREIKTFQKNFGLTVFLICSLNRANYQLPISFESFKNSGDIEYTADVVWGLQLAILSTKFFKDEKKPGLKREMISESLNTKYRQLQLVCLKNRYGKRGKYGFEYEPAYDTFTPINDDIYCDRINNMNKEEEVLKDLEKMTQESMQKMWDKYQEEKKKKPVNKTIFG